MIKKPKLKIGVLLDNNNVYEWQFAILKKIINSEFADLSLLAYNGNYNKTPKAGFFQKFFKNNKFLLYRIFKKFDNSRSISLKNAKKNRSIFELKINIPEISVYPKQKNLVTFFLLKKIQKKFESMI